MHDIPFPTLAITKELSNGQIKIRHRWYHFFCLGTTIMPRKNIHNRPAIGVVPCEPDFGGLAVMSAGPQTQESRSLTRRDIVIKSCAGIIPPRKKYCVTNRYRFAPLRDTDAGHGKEMKVSAPVVSSNVHNWSSTKR